MSSKEFDYIVVGAGTAGCLLANRLSADKNNKVLLVEAGGRDNYHWIHIPIGYLYCIGNPRTDWLFNTEPDPGLNNRSIKYPRGKVLGGCSSINGMIYMRGQARDYDTWAELTGDDCWSWDNCLPDFIAHEDHYRFDASAAVEVSEHFRRLHGAGGEWRVDRQRTRWEILDAFVAAAQQAGIPATDDFNSGDNHGVAYFELNQKDGWRWNTSKAFLRPVLSRPNLTLIHGAAVNKLQIDRLADGSLSCSGVELRQGGSKQQFTARKEVILSAGSIGSVQILQLSGVGPAELLRQHGIDVLADLPGVGANLQDHLQIRPVYKIKGATTLNTSTSSLLDKARIGLQYLCGRRGPMSSAPSQLGAFARSNPDRPYANLQYHVQPLSLDAFGEPLHTFDAFTASVCDLNPTSRGSVAIQSPDSSVAPKLNFNYLSTDEDRQVAAEALELTRRIVQQPALQAYAPEEYAPGSQFNSMEELARRAGDISTTIFHPAGTLKMGPCSGAQADPMAVVDSRLRLRSVGQLRVVDCSVMPTLVSGNTCSPTLMIAEKAARWIQDQGKP